MDLNEISVEHQQVIEAMKDQLLLVLINRLGGKVEIPAAEVDGTGGMKMLMRVENGKTFIFEVVAPPKPEPEPEEEEGYCEVCKGPCQGH